jgi:thiol-disulfide isomerase/thioredoxin
MNVRLLYQSLVCLVVLAGPRATSAQETTSANANADSDREVCRSQLRKTYEAIQAYRRAHKDLPNWLTDLVPQYLPDNEVLICPITKRTGRTHQFAHVADPKLPTSYLYEFNPLPMGGIWGGGQITMRTFKRRQMGLVGSGVPIVRCHLHQPVLNLAFGGEIYESGLNWEDKFADVIDAGAWNPARLFADSGVSPEPEPEPVPVLRSVLRLPRPEAEVTSADVIGEPAPEVKLPLLDGGQFALRSYQGEAIVLLDFWATWCPPCRTAMPILADIAKAYAAKGVRYVAVNLREDGEAIRDFLKTAGLQLVVSLDEDGSAARAFGVTAIPTLVLIDKQGRVQKFHVGASPNLKADVTQALDELLAGKDLAQAAPSDRPRPTMPIPARDARAIPAMLDLTRYYHASLTETWHPGDATGNDLSRLPSGLQTFAGVTFDVRGVVQLNGGGLIDMRGKAYPQQVRNIAVGQKCRQLHFLHATGWSDPDGTVIGGYILKYADGSEEDVPVIYGQDVRDWWVGTDPNATLSRAKVAWAGKTPSGGDVRLYLNSRPNPKPDTEITSIDYVSTMSRCAPFLIAVTVE